MIDLHSHILPGVDDGAGSLQEALEMGRMAEADGIAVIACTPHFMPGMYDNVADDIHRRVAELTRSFEENNINVILVAGADAHVRPDFLQALRRKEILSLNDSRFVLVEPPHGIVPPQLETLLFQIQVGGYVPILTHPERLRWIEGNYDLVVRLARSGVWMQLTAGALTGRFGKRPQYWAQRMLAEGLASIIATDAHNTRSRPPLMREAFEFACAEIGTDAATHLVATRPLNVLQNANSEDIPATGPAFQRPVPREGFWNRLFGAVQ